LELAILVAMFVERQLRSLASLRMTSATDKCHRGLLKGCARLPPATGRWRLQNRSVTDGNGVGGVEEKFVCAGE
jgi:hypothetical protein